MAVQIKFLVILIVGAICIIAGGVLYAVFPDLIHDQVKGQVVLKKGTTIFDNWKELAVPLYIKFYFFNVTNAEGIAKNGEKPKLKEIGPYTYSERRVKVDIKFIEADDTISYRQIKTYTFQNESSCPGCDVTDRITIPNVPVISIVSIVQTRSKSDQGKLNLVLNNRIPLYRTQTVKELIFDGYFDPFVDLVQKSNNEEILPNATFGLMYGQNNTDDGEYIVDSGINDPSQFSKVVSWKNMTKLPYWPEGTHCTMINGTDGSQYRPFITKDSVVRMFIPEIYRSVFTVYEKEAEFRDISAYRFTPTFDMFGDPTLTPDNYCFCPHNNCLPSGLLNISTGRDGAPIFFSGAHFYQGNPLLLQSVEGLSPSKEKHQTFVDIEPTTGTPVNAARKIQVNVYMKPSYPLFTKSQFAHMPEVVHPLLWIDEGAQVDQANADMFINMLYVPKKIGSGLMYGLMALGALLVVVAIGLILFKRKGIETSLSQQHLTKTTSL